MSDTPAFHYGPYSSADKYIEVHGPGDLLMRVDFDDVDQDEVEGHLEKLVAILNREWMQP